MYSAQHNFGLGFVFHLISQFPQNKMSLKMLQLNRLNINFKTVEAVSLKHALAK